MLRGGARLSGGGGAASSSSSPRWRKGWEGRLTKSSVEDEKADNDDDNDDCGRDNERENAEAVERVHDMMTTMTAADPNGFMINYYFDWSCFGWRRLREECCCFC